MEPLFYLLVLIFSIISHEVAHGLMADFFGDRTARNAGRLTFNPLPHIDLFGSIILPALSFFS
jgi:Zn-dependent protease